MTGRRVASEKQVVLEAEFRDHSVKAFRQLPIARQEQGPEFEPLLGDYAKARAARRMNYPTDDDFYDGLRNAGLHVVSEHALPVRWTFSKVDAAPGSVRKFVVVATPG